MKKIFFIFLLCFSILFFPATQTKAECRCSDTGGGFYNIADCTNCTPNTCIASYTCSPINSETGSPGSGGAGSVSLSNPLPGSTDINLIIGKAINGVLGIVGSLALVMVIYGGLTWMLAAGNQQRVTKGKDILVWAVVGLFVIFSAYALVRFIFVNVFSTPAT